METKYNKLLAFIFPVFIALVIIVLSVFQVTSSSIGMYSKYFYGDTEDPNLLAGTPRPIRSDEWLVNTPWLFIQKQAGFPTENTQIAQAIYPALSSFPVNDWTMLFKPFYWPALFLDIQYAFPFYWWSRLALLILSIYACLLILTKDRIIPSILISLALFFSPFVQWWLSQLLIEILAFSLLGLFSLIKLINARSLKLELIWGALFIYCGFATALSLYPPFQIPVILLLLFIVVGYFIQKLNHLTKAETIRKLTIIGSAVLVVGFLCLIFYLQYQTQIYAYTHTVYPGQRRITGGGVSWTYFLSGPFDIQLLKDPPLPADFFNQSEGAMYFLPALLSLPLMVIYKFVTGRKNKQVDWVWVTALAFTIIAVAWLFTSFPQWLVKFSPLQFVPPRRLLCVFGIVDLFFACWFIFREPSLKSNKVWLFAVSGYALVIYLLYLKIGFDFRTNAPLFIQSTIKINLIALIMAALVFLILTQRKILYPLAVCGFAIITTYSANPLYKGNDILTSTTFSAYIQKVSAQEKTSDHRWVVYDSIILGNYIAINGGSVINGTIIYPNVSFWQTLDPSHQYEDVYNRYAHVVFKNPTDSTNPIEFNLAGGDHFEVKVSPCSPELEQMNVDHFVFLSPVSASCLNLVQTIDFSNMPLYIYDRK